MLTRLLVATSLVVTGAVAAQPAAAASTSIVITEVYGEGGNTGAPYTHDFVELTNVGTTAPGTSNTTSATRKDPTKDLDDNVSEFVAAAPSPKAFAPPEPELARIHEIQGSAHRSPLTGRRIKAEGVVTTKASNGFWFQDPAPDADPATSEGLFVFTGSAPSVSVGDALQVTGTVAEFRPAGANSDNLSTTELTNPVIVRTGTASLPAATVVGSDRVPPSTVIDDDATGEVETSGVFEPASDGIDFWESLEGMTLAFDTPEVTGPTSGFGEISVVAPGADVRSIRGGIVLLANDNIPERLLIDDALAPTPVAKTGDKLAGIVSGVLDYSFGNFKLLVTETPTVVDGGVEREKTRRTPVWQLSVATFNVENLDPSDGPDKFNGLAGAIVDNLAAPDILALEEVQDNDGATDSGTVDADITLNTLVAAIRSAGGPAYDWRQLNPVDGADGGESGGNIRVAYLFRKDRPVRFVDRPGGGPTTDTQVLSRPGRVWLSASPGRVDTANPAWVATRKPLAAEFRWFGQPVFLVANHFSSKGGDDPLWGRWQPPARGTEPKRHRQAESVRAFVDKILTADPSANVVVLGDINDFDFSRTTDILVGSGRTALVDLPRTLPEAQRYSYVFEGNSQLLDHILMSRSLLPFSAYDIVHMNSEFPDQISDHDPQVVRVMPLPCCA